MKLVKIFLVVLTLLIVIAYLGTGIYLSRDKTLAPRHLPFHFTEAFDYAQGSFAEYHAWSERRIQSSRLDLPDEELIARLLPFELLPDADCPMEPGNRWQRGIVLTHGLIASPYSMLDIGEYFRERCFYVLGLLIPDHGTRPGDMLHSRWEEWMQAQHFFTNLMAQRVNDVYLSGHSAGGTMAVLEASRNEAVDALVLFTPSMGIVDVSRYAQFIRHLSLLFPKAAWFELENDEAVYRYESFPFNAAAETWALIRETQKSLLVNPLQIPVMTVASVEDTTVITQATIDFMQAQNHPASFTLLYSQYPLLPINNVEIQNSNDFQNGILSVSHLGIMTPPDHVYYGFNGIYTYCGQYFGVDQESYNQCKNGSRDYYGEITEDNLQRGVIERIMFNPWYDELLERIDLFIDDVSMQTMQF